MIVRLLNKGQYRIDDSLRGRLEDLDGQALDALEHNDEAALDGYLEQMWRLVETEGEELAPDSLSPSDILIPPTDLTLEETRQLFTDEGLIPDLPA